MYESRGNNNSSAKIPREKIHVQWNLQAGESFRQDREKSKDGGYNENDKNGGNSGAHVAIVFVAGALKVAHDLGRVCGVKVDIRGVESGCLHLDGSQQGLLRKMHAFEDDSLAFISLDVGGVVVVCAESSVDGAKLVEKVRKQNTLMVVKNQPQHLF